MCLLLNIVRVTHIHTQWHKHGGLKGLLLMSELAACYYVSVEACTLVTAVSVSETVGIIPTHKQM